MNHLRRAKLHPIRSGGVALALLATACGSTSSTTPTATPGNPYALKFNSQTISWLSANQNAGGTPKNGGTLTIAGSGDVDHLDTASTYTGWGFILLRATSRQLYTYPASTDVDTAYAPVPDVATAAPTISADGKTYTIKLRSNAMWNTSPPRAVTSKDFLLGFKRLCNPVAPTGAPQYYTSTIVGFDEYCTAFGAAGSDLPVVQRFMSGHDISGITTPDDSTIVFSLTKPATDFLNILALPFASAAPMEYNNYLPDSADLHSHWLSDAPYTIAKYDAGQEIDLDKNPAWQQSSDGVRHQYVDHIKITEGQTEAGVQQQLEANTADLGWDTTVPTASLAGLQSPSAGTRDPRLGIFPLPDMNPFESFNLQSPNNSGALKNVKVRQALEFAVNKSAINKIFGGPDVGQTLNQVMPPGSVGYEAFNLYPTPGDKGDPDKCKSLLAAAKVGPLTLKDVYMDSGKSPSVFQEIQKDLGACGVTVVGTQVSSNDFFGNYLTSPDVSKAGTWDIAEPAWFPDWHLNDGRTVIAPVFDGRKYGAGSSDYGDYNSDAVNKLIDQALSAKTESDAGTFWHQADMQIMQDAAVIPFRTEFVAIFHSSRVHNAIFVPAIGQYDPTQVWLAS